MKKGLIQVFSANIVYLAITFFTNFILPKFISIDSYAIVKTYSFFLFYIGFFHLGYNDGMYLEYGGKNIQDISKKELGTNFYTILLLQIVFSVITVIPAIAIKSPLYVLLAITITFTNTLSYLKTLFQAIGEFQLYGRALNYERFVMLLGYVVLLFGIKTDNAYSYIFASVFASAVTAFILIWRLSQKNNFYKYVSFSMYELKKNISMGFPLLMGGLSTNIFTGIDRWFIKILMTSYEFAMYSFAVSLESMINLFVTPITVSMYSAFCRERSVERIIKIKNIVLIWGFIIIAAAFPVKLTVEHYLTNYVTSNSIIFILFAAQAFYVVIKGVYVNLYKAEHNQSKYMKQTIAMTVVAFVLNILFYIIKQDMVAIALGTLLTAIIWLLICEIDREELRFSIRQYIYIGLTLSIYLICGYIFNSVMGLVIYGVSVVVLSLIFMKDSFLFLLDSGINMFNTFIKKKSITVTKE